MPTIGELWAKQLHAACIRGVRGVTLADLSRKLSYGTAGRLLYSALLIGPTRRTPTLSLIRSTPDGSTMHQYISDDLAGDPLQSPPAGVSAEGVRHPLKGIKISLQIDSRRIVGSHSRSKVQTQQQCVRNVLLLECYRSLAQHVGTTVDWSHLFPPRSPSPTLVLREAAQTTNPTRGAMANL